MYDIIYYIYASVLHEFLNPRNENSLRLCKRNEFI